MDRSFRITVLQPATPRDLIERVAQGGPINAPGRRFSYDEENQQYRRRICCLIRYVLEQHHSRLIFGTGLLGVRVSGGLQFQQWP
jgi:hypothetical protein